jgi:hypothetical protein
LIGYVDSLHKPIVYFAEIHPLLKKYSSVLINILGPTDNDGVVMPHILPQQFAAHPR